MSEKDYILGVNQTELDRLKFQHGVWKDPTIEFFKRIKIERGWKILDVGSGPGLVADELLEFTGEEGEITALEPSEFYLNYYKDKCERKNVKNVKFINGSVEDTGLEKNHYDMIYMRWVVDFVPEPEEFLKKLLKSLKKGGVIAIQDYVYDSVPLYPRGGAFDNIDKAVRDYWKTGGGDPCFVAKLPKFFRENEVELVEYKPIVQAGDKDSGLIEWAHKFFCVHIQKMADDKVISQPDADAMLQDWLDHRYKDDTVFFSPLIVEVTGKKTGE